MKIFILTLLVFFSASCEREVDNIDKVSNQLLKNSNTEFNRGASLGDGEIQQSLIRELDKADIAYQLDDAGNIYYNEKYSSIIDALIVQILQDNSEASRKYGMQFAKDIEIITFVSYLHSKGIDTESVVTSDEDNSVYWDKDNDAEIQKLIEPFVIEYREYQNNK